MTNQFAEILKHVDEIDRLIGEVDKHVYADCLKDEFKAFKAGLEDDMELYVNGQNLRKKC